MNSLINSAKMERPAAMARKPARRVTVGKVIASLRLFALPISLLSVPMAVAAVLPPSQWRWGLLLATTAAVSLLHLAGNLLNDYFDFGASVDNADDAKDGARPGRLLVRGDLLPGDVLTEALICLALAAVLGAYLLWQCGPALLGFALVGGAGLYAYSAPPFNLKHRAMGELTMFVVFGPTMGLCAAFVQTGRLELAALWVSFVPGFATAATLAGNNFRDREEDGRAGIKTLAQFGRGEAARVAYYLLVLGAVAVPVILAVAGKGPKVLLAAPLLMVMLRHPFACMWNRQRLPDIDARTARFEAALLLLILAAYVIWPPMP